MDILLSQLEAHKLKMREVLKKIGGIHYSCFVCDKYLIPHIHSEASRITKRVFVCCKECETIANEWLVDVP
jgi:hypothetical protein